MWAKLDDALIDHHKIADAGAQLGKNGQGLALAIYVVGLLYAVKHLTDGWLSRAVVKNFRHVRNPLRVADALVKAGLWEQDDGGFQIHDFTDYNRPAVDVRAQLDWDRRRKAFSRDDDLVAAVMRRDGDHCRYCGCEVDWVDRRGSNGAQFDHVVPRGPGSFDNVVVSCRACNSRKRDRTPEQAGMVLRPAPGPGALCG